MGQGSGREKGGKEKGKEEERKGGGEEILYDGKQ